MLTGHITKITWVLLLAIVVMLAWQAARVTWGVWAGTPDIIVMPVGGVANANKSQATQANYPAWNLFGKAEDNSAKKALSQVDAPITALRLDLYGVVVGGEEGGSGAIIAEKGKSAEYYRINEMLPGGAKLSAVFPDHVLISRNGALEKLAFDDSVAVAGSAIEQVARPKNTGAIDSPEEFVNVAQKRLEEDPRGALASVGLAPVSSGEGASGYQYDGNNPMLGAMNLQKGDVIRSVNGHTLGNIEQDRQMIQQLYESGMLEVEIERDGATFTISYPLR
ncbi:general secretion pathway protein GspC [Hahella sp. KA22]|uniref:type II secretion system protein N n=1 Tax=Hahella sp. KA22 TaxID=1628392 RepID=UPI000FDE80DE|nr:type II secretion system protein N [Hahella sp. KA22]AZZ91473.1 general secretion pathway protein GspC [Hahella sp. KA22]QAY54842.1 general secretion pathway protein GspC [Hahella sp. KA22]